MNCMISLESTVHFAKSAVVMVQTSGNLRSIHCDHRFTIVSHRCQVQRPEEPASWCTTTSMMSWAADMDVWFDLSVFGLLLVDLLQKPCADLWTRPKMLWITWVVSTWLVGLFLRWLSCGSLAGWNVLPQFENAKFSLNISIRKKTFFGNLQTITFRQVL